MISQRTIWSVQPHQRIRKILYIHELTMTGKLIFHKKLWELFWFPFRHALLFSFFVLSVPLKKPVDYKTAYPHVLSFTCYVEYHEGVKVPPTFSPTKALQSWVMHYATAARHGLSQAFFPPSTSSWSFFFMGRRHLYSNFHPSFRHFTQFYDPVLIQFYD